MAVKIRLTRCGSKKKPFYRIVAADARSPRDGKFIERLGFYDPRLGAEHPNRVTINAERLNYWLGVGAEMSERVHKLASQLKIADAPKINARPKKSAPKKKAQERAKEAAAKAAAAAESSAE